MKQTLNQLIAKAEQILNIDFVVDNDKVYYYADETDEWYRVSRADLRYAKACREFGADAYSHWCGGTGQLVGPRRAKQLDAL